MPIANKYIDAVLASTYVYGIYCIVCIGSYIV